MDAEYAGRRYVGIDLHRRRSVIVQMTPEGQRLGVAVRIDNDPFTLAEQVASWGESPEVVLEATYGWYWAADVLAEAGAVVHLAHPLGVKGFAYRRVKTNVTRRTWRTCCGWAAFPRRGSPRPTCAGYGSRCATGASWSRCAPGSKPRSTPCWPQGVHVPMSDLFGVGGQKLLDALALEAPFHARVVSLRRLIDAFTFEIDIVAKRTAAQLAGHPGFTAVQAIPGVGPILAAVFVAEIGDVTRFSRPEQLCSWAGMTPRHRESDTKVHRGRITRQGNHLVRWAATEAVQRLHGGPIGHTRARLTERHGANIAKVAAARKLLTLVYYGLRDGHLRCLARPA